MLNQVQHDLVCLNVLWIASDKARNDEAGIDTSFGYAFDFSGSKVIKAAINIAVAPIISIALTFSSSNIIPNIKTKIGSETERIEALSELIYLKDKSKSNIGIEVHIIPRPNRFFQTSNPWGIIKLPSKIVVINPVARQPKEMRKVEGIGGNFDVLLPIMYNA